MHGLNVEVLCWQVVQPRIRAMRDHQRVAEVCGAAGGVSQVQVRGGHVVGGGESPAYT